MGGLARKSLTRFRNCPSMLSETPTTITVPSSVARRLRLYKTGGRTYAQVLEEFMDVVPPREFLDWAERELEKPARPFVPERVRSRPGRR
jgi:hypothetical protein